MSIEILESEFRAAPGAPLYVEALTDAQGAVLDRHWLQRAEAVHRQLRPQLPSDYLACLEAVFAGGGRMCIAHDGERVLGLAVWRLLLKTVAGLELYVDDLVTDERQRSHGVGRALLRWLDYHARLQGCATLALDSGTQRQRAHHFYLRERFGITSFHFVKPLHGD